MLDPLDGTNNYVLGLDLYGVCITLCHRDVPVVAVVHDSPRRRTYWATLDRGAWLSTGAVDPKPLVLGKASPRAQTTVSIIQGYEVGHDDDRRNAIFTALDRGTKRLLRTWAPSVDWGLLATGRLGAVVAYRNTAWDLVGGAMIAGEAGAHVCTDPSGDVVIVGHPQRCVRCKASSPRTPSGIRVGDLAYLLVQPQKENPMCRAVTCKKCGKTTWAGCGQHANQLMSRVPRGDQCPGHTQDSPQQSWWSRLLGKS